MKAAVVTSFQQPLEIQDVPTPKPGDGEVLVKVETSGLCHTDIHAAHGDWPVKPSPPFIPGHEGVGIVERIGRGVKGLTEGDRVAVPWLGWACGACELCASGWETLCPSARYTGYTVNGGFADYLVADAAFASKVPDAIDPLDAVGSHAISGLDHNFDFAGAFADGLVANAISTSDMTTILPSL